MDKEQIRNEMIRIKIELQQNKRNTEIYTYLKEQYENLRREYAQTVVQEKLKQEEIKESGKAK